MEDQRLSSIHSGSQDYLGYVTEEDSLIVLLSLEGAELG